MCNHDIRQAARDAALHLWEIAEVLGIHDSNFSRMLRHELSNEKKEEILAIITDLAKEG